MICKVYQKREKIPIFKDISIRIMVGKYKKKICKIVKLLPKKNCVVVDILQQNSKKQNKYLKINVANVRALK